MTNNISLHIKVIAGSTRQGRFSDKAAAWIAEEIEKQKGVTVEVLDLRDYAMPFFNEPMSPSFKQEPYKNEAVARFTKKIEEGDAFVMVTPEYNHGTSAVLIPGEQYFQVLFGKINAKDLFALQSEQVKAMITQLLWWTRALKNARK